MNIYYFLPTLIDIYYHDNIFNQPLDCEHVSFHCKHFYEYGHLFHYFHLMQKEVPLEHFG